MKDIARILDRYLKRHGEPRPDDVNASLERVWRELEPDVPDVARVPVSPPMPSVQAQSWRGRVAAIAAAAAMATVSTVLVRQWLAPDSLRATVESVDGSAYRLAGGHTSIVHSGATIKGGETFRTNAGAGAMVVLSDGSRVEMRSQSELSFERADDGIRIQLRAGGIIVNAAKQPNGHLYVQTKDVMVSVVGTVFLVNAEDDGSRVAVIEGEVRVHEGTTDTRLRPGEQVATGPRLQARPVQDSIAWSRQAAAYRSILESFARGMAATAAPLGYVSQAGQGGLGGAGGAGRAGGPQFEEASIRLCDPDNLPEAPQGARGGGANSLQMTPGRLHILCMTLATIIRTAYGYSPAQFFGDGGRAARALALTNIYGLGVEDGIRVRGGPDWVRADRYTIEAIADTAADGEMMSRTMLRALLERRFQMKVRIESEQIPAFDLTVARSGLKMKEGTCTPAAVPPDPTVPRSTADMVRQNLDAARRGETTRAPCGFAGMASGPNMIFVGAGAGVPMLTGILGAPVVDRTGVPSTARFNYVLEFAPDDNTNGPIGRGFTVVTEPANVPRAANIFTAVEEQLGLKLEPSKAPREFIVIDSVARPTPN